MSNDGRFEPSYICVIAIMKLKLRRLMKLDSRNEGKTVSFQNFAISKVLQRR